MLSEMKEVARTGALSTLLSHSLSAHSLWNRGRKKKKVNTQVAPALFNHFIPPALISLLHAVTDQNLIAFVLEASLLFFLP